MAITIVATVGAADSNAFCTLAEAEVYMLGRGNKALWTAATDAAKDIALAEATQELTVRSWSGARTDDTQILSWPRQWANDPDNPAQSYFDNDIVPTRIKNATCELAFQFIKAGTTDVAAIDSKTNVKSKQIDVLRTEWFSPQHTPQGLARYPRVLAYIQPLLESSGMTTRLVRG